MAASRRNTDWLEFLDDLITEEAAKLLAKGHDEECVTEAIQQFLDAAPDEYAHAMLAKAPRMLRDRRRRERQFQTRSFKRWQPAFDRLETIWHAAEEISAAFNNRYRPEASETGDFEFEALTRLNGRGLLAAAEAIHLLKGGFAEGALSRWRTLHEILVTAMFIKDRGPLLSERYLASAEFTRYEAAVQLNRYSDRAKLEPFSTEEMSDMADRCKDLQEYFGEELGGYKWARPGLPESFNKRRITFLDLEEATGLDHWRPRYKWASQHTHAGHRDLGVELGLKESEDNFILVGASNSGFVDPMQMTALHISSLAMTLLFSRPSVDTVALAKSLYQLASELGHIAIEREDETLRRHKKRRSQEKS